MAKDFSRATYVPYRYLSWGEWKEYGKLMVTSATQSTSISRNSPRINGILVLKPQEFDRTWTTWSSTVGTLYAKNYSDGSLDTVTALGYIPDESRIRQLAIDKATRKFYSKAGGIRANLVDIYRTRAETASMIGNRLLRVARAARAVRKGNFKEASRQLEIPDHKPGNNKRKFSQDWLELSYGWSPLLGDVYELAQGFPDILTSVKVYGSETDTFDIWQNDKNPSYYGWNHWNGSVNAKACLESKVRMTGTAVKAASDLGLTNPLATAWEAVPWSFVVDWVLPIGDYIESLTALSGLEFSDTNITTTVKMDCSIAYQRNDRWSYGPAPSGAETRRHKVRVVGGVPSYPWPRIENPFSSFSRLANAFSLFRTNVR